MKHNPGREYWSGFFCQYSNILCDSNEAKALAPCGVSFTTPQGRMSDNTLFRGNRLKFMINVGQETHVTFS